MSTSAAFRTEEGMGSIGQKGQTHLYNKYKLIQ